MSRSRLGSAGTGRANVRRRPGRAAASAAACLLAAAGNLSAQTSGTIGGAAGSPKFFSFDGGVRASRGLAFRFARSVPTVDPFGQPVSSGMPRYAEESSIAGAPRFETVRQTAGRVVIMATGLDRDDVTPLLVTLETGGVNELLDVFAGGGAAVVAAERTGVGRTRTIIPATGDILAGAVPGKRYRPGTAVVCHGLIVLSCNVTSFDQGTNAWRDSATAFVVSQDRGATWSLVFESAPFAPGWPRGAPWTMQNWWPTKRVTPPLEAYFAASDYCYSPGSPGAHLSVLHATRSGPAQPWVVDPGATVFSDEIPGRHMHVGGVLPFGEHGIRVFGSIGDLRPSNRVISLVNREGNYLSGAWELLDDAHGAAGDPGVEGNQFVGCAPGPFPDSVLVGSDLSVEQIMMLAFDGAADSHPKTFRMYGSTASDGTANNAFSIRTPTPELGGPYCANSETYSPVPIPLVRRTLYSPDGVRWTQAATPDGGYPAIHAGDIYFDGAPGQGIVRTPVPAIATGRPLLIGPGGLQHSRSDPAVDAGADSRFVPLMRNSLGQWIDHGEVLVPQPPSLGPVFRVTTTSNDASPWIARIYPGGLQDHFSSILGSQTQIRLWVMHMDLSRSATLSAAIGDSASAPQVYRGVNLPSVRTWVPMVMSDNIAVAPGATLQIRVRSSSDVPADETLYFALDAAQEGAGIPGYPMPPDTSVPAAGSACPDELASIVGLNCGKAWTVTLALQLPETGFDFRTGLQRSWPLTTLWGDAANFIELTADSATGRVSASLTSGGHRAQTLVSAPTTLVRGSTILLSIAQPMGAASPEVTLSVGSRPIQTLRSPFPSASRLQVAPREIRFYAANPVPSSLGRGVAVSPLLVWGGQINDHEALTSAQRELLLRSLSFLGQLVP